MAYYGITSQSQLIDMDTISRGCTQLEAAAAKFGECAKIIDSAATICDGSALAVDKTTMQPQLEADADYIRSIQTSIENFVVGIRNVVFQIYVAQNNELATYQAQQAQQQSQQTTTNGSNN